MKSLFAAALMLAIATVSPAVASAQTVVIRDPAVLLAKGAGVQVTVEISCPLLGTGNVTVGLQQRSGKSTTSGSTTIDNVACTPEAQDIDVAVSPSSGNNVFKKGTAIATALINICSESGCSALTTAREIIIR